MKNGKGLKQFKRLKTTMMSSGAQERQAKRDGPLGIGLGKVVLLKNM